MIVDFSIALDLKNIFKSNAAEKSANFILKNKILSIICKLISFIFNNLILFPFIEVSDISPLNVIKYFNKTGHEI